MNATFNAELLSNTQYFSGHMESVVVVHEGVVPHYTGDYEVTPTFDDQTLLTKDKKMEQNLIVDAIPMAEVSNPSGGLTITIG